VIAIAIIIILATMGYLSKVSPFQTQIMAVVSSELVTSATTMASVLILVALLVGVAAASKAAHGV